MSGRSPRRLAPRKSLHEGLSLWSATPRRTVRTHQLRGSDAFEIVIVGGGISGAISALVLTLAGHDVAIVDRRPPGDGSTLASTAMIQFEIDTPLIKLRDKIGRDKADRAYLRSAKAVRDLIALIADQNLASSWIEREAIYLAGNEMGHRALLDEAVARRSIGLPSTFLTATDVRDTFGLDVTGAILSQGSGELNPARLTASCLRAAKHHGATIFSPCEVTGIESANRTGVELRTARGATITGRKVIFATGYEVVSGVPRDAFDIVSSWAIATKPISEDLFWPRRCLIWEASEPYMYIRSTEDNRVLVGGEDSNLTSAGRRAAATPAKARRLLSKAKRLLRRPELEIDYSWSGAFADSPTGLPVFKPLPDTPNAFAILGCGGNGITFSMIASDIVTAWASGRRDPDEDLFLGL